MTGLPRGVLESASVPIVLYVGLLVLSRYTKGVTQEAWMSLRTKGLLVVVVITVAGAGVYLWYQRSRADVLPEASQDFTTGAALKGSPDNQATLDNVTADDDGTIHLLPTQ